MTLRNSMQSLAAGIAAGAIMLAVQSVSAADGGSVDGVVTNASGQPVTGAFVKLKNAERRLTFMVITREQGRFDAKDLPPGTYSVQGVGAGYQSEWFGNVGVTTGGSAKVGLTLSQQQGAVLAPAWPQRIPEADVLRASIDPKDLPEGEGKALIAEKMQLLSRPAPRRRQAFQQGPLAHTVARMRTRMSVAQIPDLTEAEKRHDRELPGCQVPGSPTL